MLAEPRGEPYVVRGRMCRAAQGGRGRVPRVPLEGERRPKAGVGLVLQNPLEGSWTRWPFGNATYRANYTLKIFTPEREYRNHAGSFARGNHGAGGGDIRQRGLSAPATQTKQHPPLATRNVAGRELIEHSGKAHSTHLDSSSCNAVCGWTGVTRCR